MTLRVSLLLLFTAMAPAQTHKPIPKAAPAPTGPTAVIDTTAGRIACRLFPSQTADNFSALATGARDWTDPATNLPTHNQPFYDGTALYGVSDGIGGGDRTGLQKGTAGPSTPLEKSTDLKPDQAGLLAMKVTKGETSSSLFVILDHPNPEYAHGIAVIGLCDQPSIAVVQSISHTLLSAGNFPAHPIGINHIAIVTPGAPMPEPIPNLPEASIIPHYGSMPAPMVPPPDPTGPTAIIETSMGSLTCRLYTETPIATNNFIGLATGTKPWSMPKTKAPMHKPFYNGLHFKRVIPDFMIQQSDMPGDPGGDGTIGFHFDNEIVPGLIFDRPGRLAYANAGPNTNESEFFITEHPVPRLNGNFTIFGQCDPASVKVVESIARSPRAQNSNAPVTPITIKTITITITPR